MARKKIIWLCSWYPNRQEPFNGDFIQRHARAASLYNDIHVIYLAPDFTGTYSKKEVEMKTEPGLTEQIIYFPASQSFSGKIKSHYRWLFLYKQALRNFIIKNGKPDLAHVQVVMKAGIMAVWLKRRYKIPYAVTEHWGIYNDVAEDKYENRSRLFRYFTRQVFEKASRFISVSKYLAEGVSKLVIPLSYQVVPNVVDTKLFYRKESRGDKFRFIHVSSMVPLKNAEGILRAFAEVHRENSNTELVMVGETNNTDRIAASLPNLTPGAVSFTGEVEYARVAKEMQQANCLVLFSNMENSPCVIGEALCCGLPVIASDTGGIPELVDDSNGLLVNPGDERQLAKAMKQLIKDYHAYSRIVIAEKAAIRFSYESAGKQLDRIYDEVK